MLVRSSIGTLAAADASCADCRRTPLAGERVHELDGGRVLCDLCFATFLRTGAVLCGPSASTRASAGSR